MGMTDKLKNEIYGCGVIETAHLAYEQAKRDYLNAVSAQDKKAVSYYGKQMDILHKAWIALEDNNEKYCIRHGLRLKITTKTTTRR